MGSRLGRDRHLRSPGNSLLQRDAWKLCGGVNPGRSTRGFHVLVNFTNDRFSGVPSEPRMGAPALSLLCPRSPTYGTRSLSEKCPL